MCSLFLVILAFSKILSILYGRVGICKHYVLSFPAAAISRQVTAINDLQCSQSWST